MPHDFHFLRPEWLWSLIPLALVLWRLARTGGSGDAWRGVVDAHLLPRLLVDDGGHTRRLPLALLGLGWLLAVLAVAGPTWERLPQPVYQAQDYRVVALDLSPSMNATDLPPSRLAHARFEVLDLLHRAREGQTALVAYGAEPYVVSPLTSDTETIVAQVPGLETGLLPVQGARRTDLALDKAGELLKQAGAPDGEVILVSDGLDHPAAADEAARRLRAEGYRVSVLGVGSAKGAPVPLAGGGFLKDRQGAILMPKLDAEALRSLAGVGGGRYVAAGLDDRDIETLIPDRPAGLARQARQAEKQDTHADQWREQGPWLLLLLLPLVAFGFRRGWLAPLVLVATLAPPPQAHAFGWDDLWLRPDQQAARLMQDGKAGEAAGTFRRPDWRAAAHYQAGDYPQALETLDGVEDPHADYNRGNTLARMGQLEQAVAAYDRALERDPRDEDARYNRDLVQKLLDQKRQEQQNQQGRQGEQNQQNQSDQQGQQGQQGDQNQQNQGDQKNSQGQPNKEGQENRQDQQAQQGEQDRKGQGQQQDQDQKEQRGQQNQQEKQSQGGQGNKEPQDREAHGEQQPNQAQEKNANQPDAAQARKSEEPSHSDSSIPHSELRTPNSDTPHSDAPGLQDLLGDKPAAGATAQPAEALSNPEDRQAMEQMLRRVEDDPGGLLRQRFLLQHLRRSGQLP